MPSEREDLALSRTFRVTEATATPLDFFGAGFSKSADAERRGTDGAAGDQWLDENALIDGKYKVLARLGSGGMGDVYRVRHLQLQRDEALKTLKNTGLDMESWQRFQREAQAIAKLNCLQIVHVFDFGIGEKNVPFYTMELLDGQSLADKITQQGALKQAQALSYFEQVARGLVHAHKMNIVHRDIKPANIFVCNPDRSGKEIVKLVDFGIAKLATGNGLDSQKLTGTGLIFGSPLYMSPEQSLGQPLAAKSDQYSFGCSLYQALTGAPPLAGRNAFATMLMHQNQIPLKLSQSLPHGHFSDRMEAFVARLLAKDPEARYPSFADILEELNLLIEQDAKDFSISSPSLSPPQPVPVSGRTAPGAASGHQTTGSTSIAANRKIRTFHLVTALVLLSAAAAASVLVIFPSAFNITGTKKLPLKAKAQSRPELPQYFSVIEPGGGKKFVFPPGIELGKLELTIPHAPSLFKYQARGNVDLPPGTKVHLIAGQEVYLHPDLLSHFRNDDLLSLTFPDDFEWTDLHLAQIKRFKRLNVLQLKAGSLNASFFDALNALPDLIVLDISGCKTDGKNLLKFKRLKNLATVNADYVANVPYMIEGIVGAKTMFDLSFIGCALTDHDLQNISTIKSLAIITIENNPKITPAGLDFLSTLPGLQTLDIRDIKMGPECIPVLHKFKTLAHLKISVGNWTPEQRQALVTALPNCHDLKEYSGIDKID